MPASNAKHAAGNDTSARACRLIGELFVKKMHLKKLNDDGYWPPLYRRPVGPEPVFFSSYRVAVSTIPVITPTAIRTAELGVSDARNADGLRNRPLPVLGLAGTGIGLT